MGDFCIGEGFPFGALQSLGEENTTSPDLSQNIPPASHQASNHNAYHGRASIVGEERRSCNRDYSNLHRRWMALRLQEHLTITTLNCLHCAYLSPRRVDECDCKEENEVFHCSCPY